MKTQQLTRRDCLLVGAALGGAALLPSCSSARPVKQVFKRRDKMSYDVVIIGGGPAGLAAALTLGRARKRVLLCDSGYRRNGLATHIHNFVTRDGTSPDDFRKIGREQLQPYSSVEVQDVRVSSVTGKIGEFAVGIDDGFVNARRIILCTGMVDEPYAIPGFREAWGHSIFQCPYCHGWEVRDKRWGVLATKAHAQMLLPFVLQARGWTSHLSVFKKERFDIPKETLAAFEKVGIQLYSEPVTRVISRSNSLESIELEGGTTIACDALFAHPPQRQVGLVTELALDLDDNGFVVVDPMKSETSISGIYAAGDLTTQMQAAISGAAAAMKAAAMVNVDLSMELAFAA